MLNKILIGLLVMGLISSCSKNEEKSEADTSKQTSVQVSGEDSKENNPFFSEYKTPFGLPPFDQIKEEHYMPAFEEGMRQQAKEIEAIVTNAESPSFENTIVAYEKSGALLDKVSAVFFSLTSSNTTEKLQEISVNITPKLTKHADEISLNADFFKRIKSIYEQKQELSLNTEQSRLLDKMYKAFVRSGANLKDEAKQKVSSINQEIASLSVQYSQNVLKETNEFELLIDNKADLAGLSDAVIQAGAQAAKEKADKDKKYEGKWLYTTQRSSMYPFLTLSTQRSLREKIYKAYINRGDNDNANDNKKIASRIAYLRAQKAKLLGYKTHAHYALETKMSKTPEAVYDLLDRLWPAALKKAKEEEADMQAMAKSEGHDFRIEGWDWWYYAEKIRQVRYALDEEELKAYLTYDNALNGAFTLANKLFGITFKELFDLNLYHKDVRAFEVNDRDGSHVGVFLIDPYSRASKRGGAWMGNLRDQNKIEGNVRPIAYNVLNFPAPVGDKPSLLTFEHVTTLFHEFGHGLHGLLSQATYISMGGLNTSSDHAEFPAQIMERWAVEPEFLKLYAKHYKTGKVIPDALIEKADKAGKFNQGFATTEYLAASLLDMNWHTIDANDKEKETNQFESDYLKKIGLIPSITSRYRSTYFTHIFAGDWYSAGYYSYIWSEVLDRDAFQLFKEKGLFDVKLAASLRKNIYEAGNTDDLMKLYINFRGAKPEVGPLIKGRGLE